MGNQSVQGSEIGALKNELENAKEEIKKKDAIIMEQLKVIMELAKNQNKI